jgi:hypothetical protein
VLILVAEFTKQHSEKYAKLKSVLTGRIYLSDLSKVMFTLCSERDSFGAGGVCKGKRFRFQNVLLSDKINGIWNDDVREERKHWSEHRLASSVQKETLIFLCAEEERESEYDGGLCFSKQRDVQYCNVFRFVCHKGKWVKYYE